MVSNNSYERLLLTAFLGVILEARPGSKFIRGDVSLANPLQGRAKK